MEFFRHDQIMRAIFLATGFFEAASELLRKYFNFEDVSAQFRSVIFTPVEDQQLRRGEHKDLLKLHTLEALEERIQYLGIDLDSCDDVFSNSE